MKIPRLASVRFARPPAGAWIVVTLAVLVAPGLFIFYPVAVDDAFIVHVFARNLARGYGLVWNPADGPVEGYTSLSWILLNAIPEYLGMNAQAFSKVLGILVFGGTTFFIFKSALTILLRNYWAALFSCVLFVLLPWSSLHALSGYETMVYTFLIQLLFYLFLRVAWRKETSRRNYRILSLSILMLGLTRPEGLIPGAFVFGYCLWQRLREGKLDFLVDAAIFLVAPGLLYLVFKQLYFGSILPNTFFVKTGPLGSGLDWLMSNGGYVVPPVIVALFVYLAGHAREWEWAICAVVAFVLLVTVPYSLLQTSWIVDYGRRFLFPTIPFLVLLLALSFASLYDRSPTEHKTRHRSFPRLVSYSVFCLLVVFLSVKGEMLSFVGDLPTYSTSLQNSHIPLGRLLCASDVPPQYRSVALPDAGTVPYYSGWNTIDYTGLTTKAFAARDHKAERLIQQNPGLILYYFTKTQDGSHKPRNETEFGLTYEKLVPHYRIAGYIKAYPSLYLGVLVSRSVPDDVATEVKALVETVSRQAEANIRDPGLRNLLRLTAARMNSHK